MKTSMHRKILLTALALLTVSCDVTREESASPNATVSWAPRLTDAQGGATVPKVDKIQLLITLGDGSNRSFNQEASWSMGSIKVDGIPANVPFTATVKGLMNDGSLVWSGNSQVSAGGASAELTSAVAVTPTISTGIQLDSVALKPAGSQLARVYVTNWPFPDNSLKLLYTTDGSEPTTSNGYARTYVGPFTLTGSGKLRLRQYREGAAGGEATSSAILELGYKSASWQGCSLPDFAPQSSVITGTVAMNVNLNGSTTAGCELHYRLDGAAPTMTDPVWTASGVALGSGNTHVTLKALPGSIAAMAPSPVAEGSWLCSSCTTPIITSNISAPQTSFSIQSEDTVQLPIQLTGSNPGITWVVDSATGYGELIPHDLYATFKAGVAPATAAAATSVTVRIKATLNGTGQTVTFRVTITAKAVAQVLQIADTTGNTNMDRYPMGNGQLRLEARYGVTPVGSAIWSVTSQPSGSTYTLNYSGASASFLPSMNGDYELHAKVAQDSAVTRVHWSGLASAVTLNAMGNQTVSISSGTQAQLNVNVTGATNSSIVWNIENAGMGSLTQTGTSCIYQAPSGLAANATAYVRATLWQNGAATTQTALFTVNIQAQTSSNPTLSTAGSLSIPLNAGQSTSLNVMASGLAAPSINWNIENGGMGTLSPAGSSCIYYAPTSVPSAATVYVRASLVGTTQSLLFTINVQPTEPVQTLTVVDSMIMDITEISPVSTAPVRLAVHYGAGTIMSANWFVSEYPAGATWNMSTTGSFTSFQPNMGGTYRLKAQVGTDMAYLLVHWPTPETIASSGTNIYDLAPQERKQLMVTTTPSNAAVQWTLVGTSTGIVEPYGFYSYYQAPSPTELAGMTQRQMTVRASLVSDPSRYVDFFINVQTKPLVFRDNGAKEDTTYAVASGTAVFYLEAWKAGARATNATWDLVDKPATAYAPSWTTDAITGSISFNAVDDGIYRFKVTDGGYESTVAIHWGVP